MFYTPPASYYEPPCEPKYDRIFEDVASDRFKTVYTYDDGETIEEEETAEQLHKYYDDLHETEGLVSFEVYEIIEEIGCYYGTCEEEYREEVIDSYYDSGKLLYSEKF